MLESKSREFHKLARALGGWGKGKNPVAANFRSPSEGVAEGGGWGDEFDHARAKSESIDGTPSRGRRCPVL